MTYDCELIQDLLPLYEEGLCSDATRRAVEAHFQECRNCRRLSAPLPVEAPEEPPAADRAVKKSIRKVRRRWLSSLIAAVLFVPLLLMSFNQYRGWGLCFTNLDDLYTARKFLRALEDQNWEKAAGMYSYERDYESILDALSMEVSDWGTSFVPLELAGQPYMISAWLEREGILPATVGELYGFLYNHSGSAMIPLGLWEQLMSLEPDAFCQLGWQYWLNETLYGKISTPWGEFVVSEGRGYDTAYEYCTYFDLVPAAVYEEARPELEAESNRLHSQTHAHYGYVAEMTEEEFVSHMERSYAEDLRSMENRVSFDCTGFRNAYRVHENDGWNIELEVTLTYGDRTLDTWMDICVEHGRVYTAGLSHREQADWLYELETILYPSAHPDY